MNNEQHLCDYGCGQIASHQFNNGKWCCSKYYGQCPSLSIKLKNKWNDENSGYNSKERSNKLSKATKNNMKPGSILRENLTKKVKNKWNDPTSNYNKKEYRNKLKESGGKRKYIKINNSIIKCDYGCNNKAKYYFPISKKYCCESSWQSCTEKRKESKNLSRLFINDIKEQYKIFSKIEEMRYNPDKPSEKEIQVHCKNHKCSNSKEQDGWFTPNRESFFNRINALENDDGNDASYIYCCDDCKQECPLFNLRSDPNTKKEQLYTTEEYQTWRLNVLKREDYICEYCEEPATDVHHSRPQKLEPGFVLDPDFGVACCESCHYKYGHKTETECSTGNLASIICR